MGIKNFGLFWSKVFLVGIFFNCYAADSPQEIKIKQSIEQIFPGVFIEQIQFLAQPKLWQVIVQGEIDRALYVDEKLQNVFFGELYNLPKKENVTGKYFKEQMDKVAYEVFSYPQQKTLVFGSLSNKRKIYVFTDPNCPYCGKFVLNEVDTLVKKGISVVFLFYPVITQTSHQNSVAVWCSDNKQQALKDFAAHVQPKKMNTCTTPIDEHISLAHKLNVNGVPTILLDNKEIFRGYVPAEKIVQSLQAH